MIRFIVLDDAKEFRKKVVNVINTTMCSSDVHYTTYEFDRYNEDFEELIYDNSIPKIYILDIEIPKSKSGIDISRKIREKDWNSVIVLVTSHSELFYDAIKAQIMIMDFVSKFSNCELALKQIIKKSVNKLSKQKVLSFKEAGISHRVFVDDILYVEKDTIDRKCIINTTYSTFAVNKTLVEMNNLLDDRFYQSHRSCIVNTERIRSIDTKNSIIYFDNGMQTDLLSRDKKKGLKEYVKLD